MSIAIPGGRIQSWRGLQTDAMGRITLTHSAGMLLMARSEGLRFPAALSGEGWTHVPWPPAPGEEPVVRLP